MVIDMIKEYLKNNILITDGAMGTYYAELTGQYNGFSEFANVHEPDMIKRIHNEYIQAGAKLIKTNTFSANSMILNVSRAEVEEIIVAGIEIASAVTANTDVFVAASIGPIPETVDGIDADQTKIMDEYQFVVDVFLRNHLKIFIFETFSDTTYLKKITKYLKERDESVFILTQFATNPDGFTRKGISNENIVSEVKNDSSIDAYGFNCGIGPTHLYNSLKKMNIAEDLIAVAPNAGYPEVIHERTVYIQNTDYFAEKMQDISLLGVKILGGCCGTSPAHIKKMAERIQSDRTRVPSKETQAVQPVAVLARDSSNGFFEKMKNNKFVIAIELDPPFHADASVLLEKARICKEYGVDIITIADSPMGRARVDSVMMAAKIKREVGIEVMPHICCRDKNVNALKSTLLAGHIEGIRNVLAITGDPVAMADKNDIKSVFNLNSFTLAELVTIMNQEVFAQQPIHLGGALNLNVVNYQGEIARMLKKSEKGASFFMTQPIFDDAVIDILPELRQHQHVKILGGIMPLVSYKNAQFLNNEVAGIRIPDKIMQQFSPDMEKEEAQQLGIDIAVDIANKIKANVDGFYFIVPFNRVEMIMKIIDKIDL